VRKAFGPCIMIIYPGRFKIKTKVLTRDDQGQLRAGRRPRHRRTYTDALGGEDELRFHLDKIQTIAARRCR
jgi:hypothetical protein